MTSIPEAPAEIHEKKCTKCGTVKSLDQFHRKSTGKFGRAPHCKECVSVNKANHYTENRDRLTAYKRDYYKRNTDTLSQRNKQWRSQNQTYLSEYKRTYYRENKERLSDQMRQYQKDNIDRWLLDSHRRRMLKSVSAFDGSSNQDVIARWGEFCYLGGERVAQDGKPLENFHLEHVVPLSRGGSHTIDNLRPSCAHHNLSKGGKVLIAYLAWRTSLQLHSGELVITDADHDWYAEHCRELDALYT